LHPKYRLLADFEKLSDPAEETEDLDAFKAHLATWLKIEPNAFKITGGKANPVESDKQEGYFSSKRLIPCPYRPNVYLGYSEDDQKNMAKLGGDKVDVYGSISPMNIRMDFAVVTRGGKRIAKIWHTLDHSLVMIDPNGSLHIDAVIRHALAEYIDLEMSGVEFAPKALGDAMRQIQVRQGMQAKKTYVAKPDWLAAARGKVAGINYPYAKLLQDVRLTLINDQNHRA
jgi:hypothetical protein